MSVIDDVLSANRSFAQSFQPSHFTRRPRKNLAVLTCMDTRLTLKSLGLEIGDAHLVRNAGGILTEDAIRSLVISHYFLGTQEVMIVNHTDCGLMQMSEDEMRQRIVGATGTEAEEPAQFHAFEDVQGNVREQMKRFREHPWLAGRVACRGFVYHVQTGRLEEVSV